MRKSGSVAGSRTSSSTATTTGCTPTSTRTGISSLPAWSELGSRPRWRRRSLGTAIFGSRSAFTLTSGSTTRRRRSALLPGPPLRPR